MKQQLADESDSKQVYQEILLIDEFCEKFKKVSVFVSNEELNSIIRTRITSERVLRQNDLFFKHSFLALAMKFNINDYELMINDGKWLMEWFYFVLNLFFLKFKMKEILIMNWFRIIMQSMEER